MQRFHRGVNQATCRSGLPLRRRMTLTTAGLVWVGVPVFRWLSVWLKSCSSLASICLRLFSFISLLLGLSIDQFRAARRCIQSMPHRASRSATNDQQPAGLLYSTYRSGIYESKMLLSGKVNTISRKGRSCCHPCRRPASALLYNRSSSLARGIRASGKKVSHLVRWPHFSNSRQGFHCRRFSTPPVEHRCRIAPARDRAGGPHDTISTKFNEIEKHICGLRSGTFYALYMWLFLAVCVKSQHSLKSMTGDSQKTEEQPMRWETLNQDRRQNQ